MDVEKSLGEQHVLNTIELLMEVVQSNKTGFAPNATSLSLEVKIDVMNVMLEEMVNR